MAEIFPESLVLAEKRGNVNDSEGLLTVGGVNLQQLVTGCFVRKGREEILQLREAL
jgi:hypothetical protein